MTYVEGILAAGQVTPVMGFRALAPASHGGPTWAKLAAGDYGMRPGLWIRQIVMHSTGGRPAKIVSGVGPGGEAERIQDIWYTDPVHAAAHYVVDSAGVGVGLCDAVYHMPYHAEGSNPWSVGIELYQAPDGVIRQATVDAGVQLALSLCDRLGIPRQYHAGPYRGNPLSRMETGVGTYRHNSGGPDCVGVFGHRDNTSRRDRWDPGDAVYSALALTDAEGLDYTGSADLEVAARRQRVLVARGEAVRVDGLPGPQSMSAAKRCGFTRWRDVA